MEGEEKEDACEDREEKGGKELREGGTGLRRTGGI
jgi:hypothetical protein